MIIGHGDFFSLSRHSYITCETAGFPYSVATSVVTEVSEARDTTRLAAVGVVGRCARSLFLSVRLPARVSAGRVCSRLNLSITVRMRLFPGGGADGLMSPISDRG